ncbi:TPA: Immunoglobulin-like domain BIg-containing protein, partial [Providencia alcalifaciens]
NIVSSLSLTVSSSKVKVGESISLSIIAKNQMGHAVPNAPISISAVKATNRQGEGASPQVLISGKTNYQGNLDQNGSLMLNVTDPNGKGVKSTLRVTSGANVSKDIDVIFTVITSPDSPFANFYGHMTNKYLMPAGTQGSSFSANFFRPKLAKEFATNSTLYANGETWAAVNLGVDGNAICNSHNLVVPPLTAAVLGVAPLNSLNTQSLGWPSVNNYAVWGGNGGILVCSDDASHATPFFGGSW